MSNLHDQIVNSIVADFFDKPIMGNLYRPHYVERMIKLALGDDFRLMSADWAGWDVEHADGTRIEIKQSAARQTWTDRPSLGGKPTKGSFDIRSRTGYWADGGARWVDSPGRQAHLYIFAWHPVSDPETADHRDPRQWHFFVVPTKELPPDQKTISRTVVEKRWGAVTFLISGIRSSG
jgi:hypothetical protein